MTQKKLQILRARSRSQQTIEQGQDERQLFETKMRQGEAWNSQDDDRTFRILLGAPRTKASSFEATLLPP